MYLLSVERNTHLHLLGGNGINEICSLDLLPLLNPFISRPNSNKIFYLVRIISPKRVDSTFHNDQSQQSFAKKRHSIK